MRREPFVVVCLTLSLVVGSSCSSGFKRYECTVGPQGLEPDPQAIWACHRDIVDHAARDKKFTLLEFREAVEFFERLTSIDAGAIETEFGPVPTEELKEKLELWDVWYEQNHTHLVWNPTHQTVQAQAPDPG